MSQFKEGDRVRFTDSSLNTMHENIKLAARQMVGSVVDVVSQTTVTVAWDEEQVGIVNGRFFSNALEREWGTCVRKRPKPIAHLTRRLAAMSRNIFELETAQEWADLWDAKSEHSEGPFRIEYRLHRIGKDEAVVEVYDKGVFLKEV